MFTKSIIVATFAALLTSIGVAAPEATPRDPEAVKATFVEISSRLDQGGDLFVVANMEDEGLHSFPSIFMVMG